MDGAIRNIVTGRSLQKVVKESRSTSDFAPEFGTDIVGRASIIQHCPGPTVKGRKFPLDFTIVLGSIGTCEFKGNMWERCLTLIHET